MEVQLLTVPILSEHLSPVIHNIKHKRSNCDCGKSFISAGCLFQKRRRASSAITHKALPAGRLLSAVLCSESLIKHCSSPPASHVQLMSPRPTTGSSERISEKLHCQALHPFTSQRLSVISKVLVVEWRDQGAIGDSFRADTDCVYMQSLGINSNFSWSPVWSFIKSDEWNVSTGLIFLWWSMK